MLEQCTLHAEAEGSAEGQWLHCLALAASLLERMPSKRAHLAGASGCIKCLDDLSRLLIMPAMQHSSATIRQFLKTFLTRSPCCMDFTVLAKRPH